MVIDKVLVTKHLGRRRSFPFNPLLKVLSLAVIWSASMVLVSITSITTTSSSQYYGVPSSPSYYPPANKNNTNDHDFLTRTTIRTGSSKPKFDCAINWVRIPKTASTSVQMAFMNPLMESKLFTSTLLQENVCVMGPGGCADFWKNKRSTTSSSKNTTTTIISSASKASQEGDGGMTIPYYGIGPMTDRRNIINETRNLARCFLPTRAKTHCYEFDKQTNIMTFGPPSKLSWFTKVILDGERKEVDENYIPLESLQQQNEEERITKVMTASNNGTFYITPHPTGHTGLDTSLFGWIMPKHPLVFSIFRDPVDRLLSSFHHGIEWGANRPGHVNKCRLVDETWREKVAQARKQLTLYNDTTTYHSMLRRYLQSCKDATNNAYTRFLDPLTTNLSVALNHLESHVIVGLQDSVDEALQRWTNITLDTCRDHPQYSKLSETLTASVKSLGNKKQKVGVKVKDWVRLVSPDISMFDMDLQNQIRTYTAEDEVIYKRAIELYHEQKNWA